MTNIYLTNSELVAIIDDEDVEKVTKYKWYINRMNHKNYVVSTDGSGIMLHCIIMDYKEGYEIDHRDGNPLNNQKDNLRYATRSQNAMNSSIGFGNSSGYKGVHFNIRAGSYTAQIVVNRRKIHLGTFKYKENAARAYNRAATNYFGEFACLNIIKEQPGGTQ